MAAKKIKPNRYKPETLAGSRPAPGRPRSNLLARITSRKWAGAASGLLLMAAMSLSAIWLHDAVVQSPFFTIRTVEVSGLNRVSREALLDRAGLDRERNLFEIRPEYIEKRLAALPWIARARVERHFFSKLSICVEEEMPLAIVAIENLSDLIINTQGMPFKEYDPEKDQLNTLPVITGVDLTLSGNIYRFEGALFNSVMDLLKVKGLGRIRSIHGDPHTGILIQAPDIYNRPQGDIPEETEASRALIPIKLGFDGFEEKLAKAIDLSRYMAARFPEKIILAMDLYDMNQIFIKTENALHHYSEKGVQLAGK
ncbi:MAG: FtsQ-type POTRA domain-containing protein [Desulfobacter sp.]|nr:MAG: FtsQ-type POTRA domain-containing protein [Desulfobacter sp.]